MNDVSRTGLTLNGSTPGRREQHFDLPTWYARLAGATPRTAPVSVQPMPTSSAAVAAPRALPVVARPAA